MDLFYYFKDILPQIVRYRLMRFGINVSFRPIVLTFSVTNRCQSHCLTCRIWELYQKHPERIREELNIDEIKKIFQAMPHIFFFNISGGEPFLREDLVEIIKLACRYLTPGIIHIPTNALLSKRIEKMTDRIAQAVYDYSPEVPLTIKPSIDGIGENHDRIRGVKGNFEKLIETIERLKKLEKKHPNLHLELGTVVSMANIDDLDKISDFVHGLGVESYRNEIAEQREEFFNINDPITPTPDVYKQLMENFSQKIRKNIFTKRDLAKITESLRLVYYDLAARTLMMKKQVIPCYAGISNIHLTPYGDVWPCCVLGYTKPMGNLRETNYDFNKIWHSSQAKEVRRYITDGNCYCPLANQMYSNILCNIPSTIKGFLNIVYFRFYHYFKRNKAE
ncbi:MAG: radical SAM/SPASM domain-containing protein [bacterium]